MNARRVAEFVDSLLRNRRPRRFEPNADDVEAMRAAIDLRAAQPGAALPTAEFVGELHRTLARQLGGDELDTRRDRDTRAEPRGVTRRGLLGGLGIAAAAAGAGILVDQELLTSASSTTARQATLQPDNGTWQDVMAADEIPAGTAARFATSTTIGFVVNDRGRLSAVSGVCTHQGCLLRQEAAGRLECPCHRAAFDLRGKPLYHEQRAPLAPLPRIDVRANSGRIEVFVPPPV
jgi:cytochrome b6-f complex iron-sulfur subunit